MVKVGALAASIRHFGRAVKILGCGDKGPQGVIAIKPAFAFHSTPVPRAMTPIKNAVLNSDVVHIVGFRDPLGTAAAYFAHRAAVPYVLEPAGMHRSRIRSRRLKAAFDALVGQRIVAHAGAVIATSNLEKGELIEDGVEESRVVVRPNGLALEDHGAGGGGIRRRFGIPEAAPLVVHIGRISKKKGLMPLVRAVASIDRTWLLIAGPDDGDGTLRQIKTEAERAGERVIIESQGLWGREKWAAYAEANAFCMYSETENFGNAAAEAASAGLPVVVTDSCGIAEWLDPAASKVIPFGNESLLRSALSEILSDQAYKAAATEGATRLRESLNWDRIALLQIQIYDSVLGMPAQSDLA